MAATKFYEEGGFRIELTPQGDPHRGTLVTRFPEMAPYAAEVDLSKKRSRSEYANDAAEVWGVEEGSELAKDPKRALIAVHVRRLEEVAAAREAEQEEAEPAEAHPEVSEEEMAELVGEPGVLDRFVEDAARIHGVVGEREPLKLLTLNAFGAQLELQPNGKPLGANVVLTAEWGRGKNHLCDAVATLLPEDFYLAFESASAKSLYYRAEEDPKILAHKWLYLNEAEAMDQLVEMLRPLLSGGKASHLTVNQVDGQNAAQELLVEGPVTITIPTIRNKLDAQLNSRLLTADLPDYEGRVAGHSRATSKLLLPGYASEDYSPRIRAWQAALGSLTALRRVVFPLDEEGFCFDRDDVSHGARLWTNVLGLMCAHAMLEQRNREAMTLPNGERAVVATPADYEAAYNVFKATCERTVQNFSDAHRKILDGLYEMTTKNNKRHWSKREQGWSQRAIERHTGVSQSTISAQRAFLTKSLKLVIEDHKGRLQLAEDVDPSLWETDDALDGFPRPGQVWAWWNGDDDPPDPERPGQCGQAPETTEKRNGKEANGDRYPTGHHAEASDHPARDEAGPHDDRVEEHSDRHAPGWGDAAQERKGASKVELTDPSGGLGDRHEEVSEEDGGPPHAAGNDHGWRERYLRDMERRLGAGWETQLPGILLGKLGWARYEGLPTDGDLGSEDSWGEESSGESMWELMRDPVSREILNQVCIFDAVYGRSAWVATDGELCALRSEHEDKEGLYRTGGLPDLRDARERLADMLPALLRVKRRFWDPGGEVQGWGVGYEYSEATIFCERWEKEGEDEGLWYFVARKAGQHIPHEEVEDDVWVKVSYIEGLYEGHYSPRVDVFGFDD